MTFEQRDSVMVATVRTAKLVGVRKVDAVIWAMVECVVTGPCNHLLLDFQYVSHVSKEFASKLAGIRRAVEVGGGTLRSCALCPEVRVLLEPFRLEEFCLNDNAGHALQSYTLYLRSAKTKLELPHAQFHAGDHKEGV